MPSFSPAAPLPQDRECVFLPPQLPGPLAAAASHPPLRKAHGALKEGAA